MGAGVTQPLEESEAAKKERMYQAWMHTVREFWTQRETNLPAEHRRSLTNFANSADGEKLSRDIFEANWVHSSFGLYWDEIPPPTIRGSNATVEVDKFIAEKAGTC
jgi:hypothetical protein